MDKIQESTNKSNIENSSNSTNFNKNIKISAMETKTATISTVSSTNTNPFTIHISKTNPFHVSNNNTNIDSNPANKNLISIKNDNIKPQQILKEDEAKTEIDLTSSKISGLPRNFEKLNLNTSVSIDIGCLKDDNLTSKVKEDKQQDYEGIINDYNSQYNNFSYFNASKSPPNPFMHPTAFNTNTNELTSKISKCLSQSSSTTTITSSSSRASSVIIESPSKTIPSVPSISPSPPLSNLSNQDNYNQLTQSLTYPTTPPSPLPPLPKHFATPHIRILPKTHSLDLADEHCIHVDPDDIDADVDEDDDSRAKLRRQIRSSSLRREVLQSQSEDNDSRIHPKIGMKHSKSELTTSNLNSPAKNLIPKIQSAIESRPIYPNVPYSPYGSPYGSPRSNRRRTPLRESRRVSIEQSGSFLQLNQYKLMDQIGQGSYGLVKLAYSEEDSTHYAMKILSKRRLLRKAGLMGRGPKRTTSPLDRVYREIAVLKKLDHPNVVKLIEVLDDPLEDSLYLVFELVQQGEVLSIPTDCPLSEERAWSVFRDGLQGLEYLHYQRIIHADIKPGNLLLGENGKVKIADLGVCNEFLGEDAAMNNGSTAGTPAFRAPETLIPGQHLYSGKAADIWALGATLYALVFGNVPFVAKSVPAVYEKIKHDQLKFPDYPKISNELRDLIEKILTKDPSKRITLPQIKEHPWVTKNGAYPLPSEEENCRLVQISDEDIHTVVKSIPKLDTLILIKTMLKNHSFQNPFSRGISGRGGSRLERFTRAGRSNSAPGAYHLVERQLSTENILPAVSEGVASSCNESSDHSPDG